MRRPFALAAVVVALTACQSSPADDRKVCDAIVISPQQGFAPIDMDGDGWFTLCVALDTFAVETAA